MPRSSIATGLVDFVLPVEAMPETLMTYWRNADSVRLPLSDTAPRDESAK